MKYTAISYSLIHDRYFTFNVGDIIAGIDINFAPDRIIIFAIDKTGRDF